MKFYITKHTFFLFIFSLLRLRNFGILYRITNKYYKLYYYQEYPTSDFSPLNLKECMPFFLIWICGVAASVIIICLEILCKKYKSSIRPKKIKVQKYFLGDTATGSTRRSRVMARF